MPGDSADNNQILINGRLWHSPYSGIKGNPFLFGEEFLPGSVTISSKTYQELQIRYDIFTDEIMIPFERGILQLNKELIDSFSFFFNGKLIRFKRIPENSPGSLSGYVQNMYTGKTALYIKYQKKIDRPGIINEPDNYFQIRRIYVVKESFIYPVKNKNDLFRIFKEEKEQIRDYLRKNRVHVTNRNPGSYSAILRYHDSISP